MQKLEKTSKIQLEGMKILCSSLRISSHLPAPTANGGEDRF